jgi:hypothetical protein
MAGAGSSATRSRETSARAGKLFFRDLVDEAPSLITYANPNMPKEILDEDRIIEAFPLDISADKVKIAPAAEFFRRAGLPGKDVSALNK